MLVLLVSILLAPLTQTSPVRLNDDSDWWSIIKDEGKPGGIEVQVQKAETAESNFKILGADLGHQYPLAKLGRPTSVQRGDAGNFRSQTCYASSGGTTEDSNKVYLVFEDGEVTSAFYLFAGGPPWHGSDLCVRSPLVSRSTRTGSGLYLGMTIADLEKILGKPSGAAPDRLVYSRLIKKKMSPEDLKKLRTTSPGTTDEDLQRNVFWDVTVYIEARFSNDKMTYLAVMRAETN
jgi:hypothetical protein